MKLQIAMDTLSGAEVLHLLERVHDVVDIVEIGTPLILREGLAPVRAVKERYPGLTVLADTKIVDGGRLECGDAVAAGADIVTVLAAADDATIQDVITAAHEKSRFVMVDLIGRADIAKRAEELLALDADFICVHTGVDAQKSGRTPLGDLKTLVAAIPPECAAVAGGVSPASVRQYAVLHPGIIIAGGALTGAQDPRAAAAAMRTVLKEEERA